jgi:hypothetical protein
MPDPVKDGDSETAPENFRELLREQGASSRRIAKLLDECFRIPGTKIRFGFDPILGLIPGGGEVVATIIGAYIVGDATRKGIPFSMLFKMAGNLLLNGVLGVIPGVGDVFSVWFKSNSRNYRLMREHLESTDGEHTRGGWWPMIVASSLLGTVFMINILIWFLVWRAIYELITRLV